MNLKCVTLSNKLVLHNMKSTSENVITILHGIVLTLKTVYIMIPTRN